MGRVASIEIAGEMRLSDVSDQLLPTNLAPGHAKRVKRNGGVCDLTYWIGRKSSDCPGCITCLYATCSLNDPKNHSDPERCRQLMEANRSFRHMLGLRSMVGSL